MPRHTSGKCSKEKMSKVLEDFMQISHLEDETVAANYLQMAKGSLEKAISLWLEFHPSVPSLESESSSYFPSKSRSSNPLATPFVDEEDSRTPDQIYTQRLLVDDAARTRRRHQTSDKDQDAQSSGSSREASSPFESSRGEEQLPGGRATTLAEIFAPPSSLNFKSDFQEAKDAALKGGKLLLVNIQDNDLFESHKLNRDIWSNETVQGTIRCNYVFWQRALHDEDGEFFCDLYRVLEFPYVGVINPRTGMQAKVMTSRQMSDAITVASLLIEFLEHNQLFFNGHPKAAPAVSTARKVRDELEKTSPFTLNSDEEPDYSLLESKFSELRRAASSPNKESSTSTRLPASTSVENIKESLPLDESVAASAPVFSPNEGSNESVKDCNYSQINSELHALHRLRQQRSKKFTDSSLQNQS